MEKIIIDESVLNDIIKYCEDNQIYDKLAEYNDFYYKVKSAIQNHNDNNWQSLALNGQRIDAIKEYKKLTGANIKQCAKVVDNFIQDQIGS